jgi:hypothetical protein
VVGETETKHFVAHDFKFQFVFGQLNLTNRICSLHFYIFGMARSLTSDIFSQASEQITQTIFNLREMRHGATGDCQHMDTQKNV